MSRKLIAYFSFSGHTKTAAESLAKLTGADLYRIEAAEPYTREDLDWHNDQSRGTRENDDPDARPALAGALPDLSAYDDVYLGFPIWFGVAPRVINTFVDAEATPLAAKRVALFCTSGGSPIDYAREKFCESYPQLNVVAARRIAGEATEDLM